MLPHSLPASLRSTGGAQDLLSLLHLGASRCPPPCPSLAGSSPWLCPWHQPDVSPAPMASQAVPTQRCPLSHCCPCLCLCKLQELSLACHLVWVPWGLTTIAPEAVTRALQTLIRGSINLGLYTLQFRCVSLGKASSFGQAGGKLEHPLEERWFHHVPKHHLHVCAAHQARLLHFMSYVIVFTFNDFHHVKLPTLGRGVTLYWIINRLCVFPAWDCRTVGKRRPSCQLPPCWYPSVGLSWCCEDQEAAPGALISCCDKIHCSGNFSEGCTFILKSLFYSSHQLCFYLLFNLPSL